MGFSPDTSRKRPLVLDKKSFASGATDILQSEEKSYRRQARMGWLQSLKQMLGLGPRKKSTASKPSLEKR